jgi:hypothetical protein
MVQLQNVNLTKRHIDNIASLQKRYINKMPSRQNGALTKYQVGKMMH